MYLASCQLKKDGMAQERDQVFAGPTARPG